MTDSNSTLTLRQAQLCAHAWHEVRPEWGIPSMLTLLEANRDHAPFAELLRAGINAALNPKVLTPAVIFKPGKHWHGPDAAGAPAPSYWGSNDTSEDCPNHPTVKAWDCKPCRRADPPPPNLRERIAAEAEKHRAARAARLTTNPTSTKEEHDGPAHEPEPTAA